MNYRNRMITLRLLPQEATVLADKAREANMSKACFLKNAIRYGGAYRKENFTGDDQIRLIYELNRIGNNVNQIMWRSHSSREIDDEEMIQIYDIYLDLLSAFD